MARGSDYDARWSAMAAAGRSIHGEADFIAALAPRSVLDAGCGTGRVAIELARRGVGVVGVDLDAAMLGQARTKAPELTWVEADLIDVDLGRRFDVVAMPGNVMIFVAPGTEAEVVANLARHVAPNGALVAGFQLDRGYHLERYDADCAAAGLACSARFATWESEPWTGGDYAVSVHRRALSDPRPTMAGVTHARPYDDIPGTYVFDARRSREGYPLNQFCMSLRHDDNRHAFRADEAAYLDRFALTPAQRAAVLARDWNRLLDLGGNIYYTFKLAACDGMTFQQLAAKQTGLSEDDYVAMMLAGGRPIEGNRSRGVPGRG